MNAMKQLMSLKKVLMMILSYLKKFFSVLHSFEDKLDDGESVIYWLYHKVNNCKVHQKHLLTAYCLFHLIPKSHMCFNKRINPFTVIGPIWHQTIQLTRRIHLGQLSTVLCASIGSAPMLKWSCPQQPCFTSVTQSQKSWLTREGLQYIYFSH